MKPNRVSNKVKQRQLQTKYLQEQTKKMQQKLNQLKKQVQQQKQLKATTNFQTTVTRWQKVTRTDAPLKSYAKQILQEQKQAYKKFGIDKKKITGSQTFSNIKKKLKQQRQIQEQKKPTKIPIMKSQTNYNNYNKNNQLSYIEKEQQQLVESIQNNFMKAKMDIKKLIRQKTVLEFLEQIFLQQYYKEFEENNITELSDLRFVTREQLQEMGVAKGHQVKILKRIKEEFEKSKSPSKNPFILKEQDVVEQKPSSVLVQMGYGQGNINNYADIQIRQQQQKQQQQYKEENDKLSDAQSQNIQDEQNDVVLITVPFNEIALQSGDVYQDHEYQMGRGMAENCFQCYRMIPLKNQLIQSPDKRNFCSLNCLKMYKLQMQKTCPQCKKQFYKTQGFYQQGFWVCSLPCSPNKDQIEEMFLEWTHKHR